MNRSQSFLISSFTFLIFHFSFLIFVSCEADNEYSTWPCRFAYDNSVHLDATLASAMDVNVPGMFCLITETVQGGVKYLNFKSNHNAVSSLAETEAEKRAEFPPLPSGISWTPRANWSPPAWWTPIPI